VPLSSRTLASSAAPPNAHPQTGTADSAPRTAEPAVAAPDATVDTAAETPPTTAEPAVAIVEPTDATVPAAVVPAAAVPVPPVAMLPIVPRIDETGFPAPVERCQ